ncbi:MAG: hypothetical protein JW807_14575 [Spirochaetes bacterium]|nr:hypothetical protein [Spirochaetota bacterium]
MMIEELKRYFTRDKLIRDSLVCYIFMLVGMALLLAMYLLARIPSRGGNIYHLLQNIGLFLLFTSLLLAYAAVHRGNAVLGSHTLRSMLLATVRQAHILVGIALGSVLGIFAVALVQVIFTFFGYIPYAGPVIVALFSLPFFAVNAAVIAALVMVWVIAPPMIAEGAELRRLPADFWNLVKKRGLIILGYTMAAFVGVLIFFGPILMIVRYAVGITRGAQWNIAPAYPNFFQHVLRPSYVTDILQKITPQANPIEALRQYGTAVFDYVNMLGIFLSFLYGILFLALAAFMIALFFNVMSFFYTKVKNG